MPGQSGPGSNGIEGVLHSPQITGTSPSDCLVSYPGHSLGGSYPSAEVQSVYSTIPTDWANKQMSSGSFKNSVTYKWFTYKEWRFSDVILYRVER